MIKHVITRVNPEKTKKKGVTFSRLSSYKLGQRADLCRRPVTWIPCYIVHCVLKHRLLTDLYDMTSCDVANVVYMDLPTGSAPLPPPPPHLYSTICYTSCVAQTWRCGTPQLPRSSGRGVHSSAFLVNLSPFRR